MTGGVFLQKTSPLIRSLSRARRHVETGSSRLPPSESSSLDCILPHYIIACIDLLYKSNCHYITSWLVVPMPSGVCMQHFRLELIHVIHCTLLQKYQCSVPFLTVSSYVETAVLKCYSFLTNREYTQALIRLTRMVRGIGDPLVAVYARAYLCRVGMSIAPDSRSHLMPNFTDYLATLSQVCGSHSSSRF